MHPYTEALLSAIPITDIDDQREPIILEDTQSYQAPQDVPTPDADTVRIYAKVVPELEEVRPGHFVACHHKLNNGN